MDQSETVQTNSDGSVTDTISSYDSAHVFLGTIVKTASGNGLVKVTTFNNASGSAVDTQSSTTAYDSNGDGGTSAVFKDNDVVVISGGTATFTTSVTTLTSGNAQNNSISMTLSGALASTNSSSFSIVASGGIAIADSGVTTETITDKTGSTTDDTTTIVTAANKLTSTTSTALNGSGIPYIVDSSSIALDGSKSDTTTYYNPASSSVIEEQTTVSTSYDGRTITTTRQSDYDSSGHYNSQTDTYVAHADDTATETRSGTGSFGAPVFSLTVSAFTNGDSSQTTTTSTYDGAGALIGQIVADVSPDGLVKSFVYDTTGTETANLTTAAADLLTSSTLPTLLMTDIIETDTTTLNSDGSRTEIVKTAYGNSFTNLRTETTTTISANGLVTSASIDNSGNTNSSGGPVYDQVDVTTIAPDGSKTEVVNYYGNTAATNTLSGTNTYTTTANGLVTTLTTSTGITDVTADFADSNGSYEWSRAVTSAAHSAGYDNESSSHFIDANGIDTWSYNDGNGHSGTITIDVATETQDIAIANEIYVTLLGHAMDDTEKETLAQDITNGVLDRDLLAYNIINSSEYNNDYGIGLTNGGYYYGAFDVLAAIENALGRPPTAEEIGTFGYFLEGATITSTSVSELALMAVAVAQYATDQGGEDYRTLLDTNADLATTAPAWDAPADHQVVITSGGTYNSNGTFFEDQVILSGQIYGVTATVSGNNNVIALVEESNMTVSGVGNSVDIPIGMFAKSGTSGTPITVNASNTPIMVENGGSVIVFGNNDQIGQVGYTEVVLSSGSGDSIYVAGGTIASSAGYMNTYPITSASNALVTVGSGAGTSASAAQVDGNNDSVSIDNGAWVTVSGASNTINVYSGGVAIGTTGSSGTGNTINIYSGGVAIGTTVSSGGGVVVSSGGIVSNSIIWGGATEVVNAGGVDSGTTLCSAYVEPSVSAYVSGNMTDGGGQRRRLTV